MGNEVFKYLIEETINMLNELSNGKNFLLIRQCFIDQANYYKSIGVN